VSYSLLSNPLCVYYETGKGNEHVSDIGTKEVSAPRSEHPHTVIQCSLVNQYYGTPCRERIWFFWSK